MAVVRWVEGLVFVLIGLVAGWEGLRLVSRVDPDSIKDVLGPGYYIVCLGAVLGVVGLWHLAAGRKRRAVPGATPPGPKGSLFSNLLPLYSLAALGLYVALVQVSGYLVSTFVFFLLQFRLAGVPSWGKNLALTTVVVAVFYVLFVHYCRLVFPEGLLMARFSA